MRIELLQRLVGKMINGLNINDDRTNLVFTTNTGNIGIGPEGDCCSHSWFEHFSNIEALLGKEVISVKEREEVDQPEESSDSYDCIAVYGFDIVTTKGTCYIEMRNSSNGYYGGYLIEGSESLTNTTPVLKDF